MLIFIPFPCLILSHVALFWHDDSLLFCWMSYLSFPLCLCSKQTRSVLWKEEDKVNLKFTIWTSKWPHRWRWTTYDFDNMPFNDSQMFSVWFHAYHTIHVDDCSNTEYEGVWRCMKVPSRAGYSVMLLVMETNTICPTTPTLYLSKTSLYIVFYPLFPYSCN